MKYIHTNGVAVEYLAKVSVGLKWLFAYIVNFVWLKDLVRWMISVGGNVAESAFLLATVYVTLNTVAHPFMAMFLNDGQIKFMNFLSIIAFSVIPELIILNAMKETFDHWMMARATKTAHAWGWFIAYALPTLVFLVMTVITITSFVDLSVHNPNSAYQVTGGMLVTRCLTGWFYGMVSMLFAKLGKKGYVNTYNELKEDVRLLEQKLEETTKDLHAKHSSYVAELERKSQLLEAQLRNQLGDQSREMEALRLSLDTSKKTELTLLNAVNKSDEDALAGYPEDCIRWLKGGDKSVIVTEIIRFTGHSKRKITEAIKRNDLQVSPRNHDLILMTSLTNWLKKTPSPTDKDTDVPHLHIVNE